MQFFLKRTVYACTAVISNKRVCVEISLAAWWHGAFHVSIDLNRLLHSWGTKLRFLLFKTSVYHVFVCANIVNWSPPWSVSIAALPPAVFFMVNLRGMCFIVLINHLHTQLWNRVITISLLHSSCQSRPAASIDTRAATYKVFRPVHSSSVFEVGECNVWTYTENVHIKKRSVYLAETGMSFLRHVIQLTTWRRL